MFCLIEGCNILRDVRQDVLFAMLSRPFQNVTLLHIWARDEPEVDWQVAFGIGLGIRHMYLFELGTLCCQPRGRFWDLAASGSWISYLLLDSECCF